MYELRTFSWKDLTDCGARLRSCGAAAKSMEGVASNVVELLHDSLVDGGPSEKATALVRFYKTHPYDELPADLREIAATRLRRFDDRAPAPKMKCFTLMASAGEEPAWNGRGGSKGHKVIPLPSPTIVEQLPMFAQLMRQFGLGVNELLTSSPTLMLESSQQSFNVFHVADAVGSPFIPAQEQFVVPYAIRSVLGFGGMLPTNDVFAVILFSKTPIERATAELFKTLALNVKMAVLPFSRGPHFDDGRGAAVG